MCLLYGDGDYCTQVNEEAELMHMAKQGDRVIKLLILVEQGGRLN